MEKLQNTSEEDIKNFDDHGQKILDVVAERSLRQTAVYLLHDRSISPFEVANTKNAEFFEEDQANAVTVLTQQFAQGNQDLVLAQVDKYKIADRFCFPTLSSLFENRWANRQNDKAPLIMQILKSSTCAIATQSAPAKLRSDIFAKEYMFQYQHGFKNFTVISTYAIRALIEYPTIEGVDPLFVLDLKSHCLTHGEYEIWRSFIKKTLGWDIQKIPLRLTTSAELGFRERLTAAGYMEQMDEEAAEINKTEIIELKHTLNIQEDKICE